MKRNRAALSVGLHVSSHTERDTVFAVTNCDRKSRRGGRRNAAYAFTELGVAMLSSVLSSLLAIRTNIQIMRAFVVRAPHLDSHGELAEKIDELQDKSRPEVRRRLRRNPRAHDAAARQHARESASGRRHHRQLDEARLAGRVIDPLRRLAVVRRLRAEDVRHEGLRIAIVEREPARLHLHHDAVARQEDVVRRRQREAVRQRLVGGDRLRRARSSRDSGRGRCRPTPSTDSRPAPAAPATSSG